MTRVALALLAVAAIVYFALRAANRAAPTRITVYAAASLTDATKTHRSALSNPTPTGAPST